jgi:mRNA interferase MazF
VKRGEVWIARLNPARGGEAGKDRPVVIVQEDRLLQAEIPTVLIASLTTKLWRQFEPLRVFIKARDNLQQDCHVMVEQLRALDRNRIADGPLTALASAEMAAVEKSMKAALGLY